MEFGGINPSFNDLGA